MASVQQSKRRRLNETIQLTHQDYTVGWICALPCELTAAEAMFDKVHETLLNPPHDKNVYSFGSISGHNVIVTTLPLGVYGTTSATTVAIRMTSTFKSISIPLLVGVGGGTPHHADMRLGDVVVSVPSPGRPAIIQHDYGKTLVSGRSWRTGHLNKPAEQLLAATARVQAAHRAGPSKIPAILQEALQNANLVNNGFAHPGSDEDLLYVYSCEHSFGTNECTRCNPTIAQRQSRPDQDPRIHYGSIASGNQVIKSAKFRDQLVSELGVICFEMEAAGIMDCFPALVIRGVCDYCDSQKNKRFQPYAALTAAAFAKELLMFVPRTMADQPKETVLKLVVEPRIEEFEHQLDFQEAQSRLMNVKKAHPKTLNWISSHTTYLNWLDDEQMEHHHGLLWIKGKPGAGKSTLMKHILSKANTHVISFFFNARGTELQRTTLGMYRSLLLQLVRLFPELWQSVDLFEIGKLTQDIGVLRATFEEIIAHIQEPFICFIDALDESSEDEVRELMEQLENILEGSHTRLFRVCCSSRYYPNISINIGLELRLDVELGHTVDIQNYVEAKLRIGGSEEAKEIKKDVAKKAGGVFLWVVLVVQILVREYDRGRVHALRMKLDEIPAELNQLIRDILVRDNEDLERLVICLQWILFSNYPLSLNEFYHAIFAADDSYNLEALSPGTTERDMDRFILNCSKGLLETVWQTPPQIQVIHESVREFLLGNTLVEIWSGFARLATGTSHDMLAKCCLRYLIAEYKDRTRHNMCVGDRVESTVSSSRFPLRDYAAAELLIHANAAEEHCVSQLATICGIIEQPNICPDGHLTFTKQLARYGKMGLFRRYLSMANDTRATANDWAWEIVVSIRGPCPDIAYMLLGSDAISHSWRSEILEEFVKAGKRLSNGDLDDQDAEMLLLEQLTRCVLGSLLLANKQWICKQDPCWIRKLTIMRSKRELTYSDIEYKRLKLEQQSWDAAISNKHYLHKYYS